jgi:uncharacterized protein involved in type VI secretion and phage assembly
MNDLNLHLTHLLSQGRVMEAHWVNERSDLPLQEWLKTKSTHWIEKEYEKYKGFNGIVRDGGRIPNPL